MMTTDTKLFVQLQPDEYALEYFKLLQESLSLQPTSRPVKTAALHMTVLHIGLVERLLEPLPISTTKGLQLCRLMLDELQAVVRSSRLHRVQLVPVSGELLGVSGGSLVVLLEPTAELLALHRHSLTVLQRFIQACGVTDVEQYMLADYNLRYALTLKPHVTIVKNYHSTPPDIPSGQLGFTIMPLEY
jgi:hypothetical protein